MARQVASKQPKILWDLNPCSPTHRIYVDYIDKYAEKGLLGGYNYGHFTINDNLSISDERREEIKSMYDDTSIWYRRDILGERCVAEGLVHKKFAENIVFDEHYDEIDLVSYKIIPIFLYGDLYSISIKCSPSSTSNPIKLIFVFS